LFGRLIYIWRAIFCSWWVGDDLFRGVVLTLDPLRLLQEAASLASCRAHCCYLLAGWWMSVTHSLAYTCSSYICTFTYARTHTLSALAERYISMCVRNATQTAPLQHLSVRLRMFIWRETERASQDQLLMHVQLHFFVLLYIHTEWGWLSGKIVLRCFLIKCVFSTMYEHLCKNAKGRVEILAFLRRCACHCEPL
jgi:hypothetical protein